MLMISFVGTTDCICHEYKAIFLCIGYSSTLAISLVQEFDIPDSVAKGLVRRYGGRAHEVLEIAQERDVACGGIGLATCMS